MLDVTVIMNSDVEEIFSFKCCNLHELNLEILVRNRGERPVTIANYCVLESGVESLRCSNLYPPYHRRVSSGETVAFYSSIADNLWKKFSTICIFDDERNEYRFPINRE